MEVIILIVSLIIYFAYLYLNKTFFHPAQVFILLWSSIYFLYELRLSPILTTLDLYTWVLILLWVFAFFAGSMIFDIVNLRQKPPVLQSANAGQLSDSVVLKSVLFSVAFLLLYFAEALIMTPPLFSANIFDTYMKARGLPIIHYGVGMMTFTIPLGMFIFMQSKSKKITRAFFLFAVLAQLIAIISWMQRGIFLTALIAGVYIYYVRSKARTKLLALKLVGFFLAFALIASVIGNYRTSGGESFGGESVGIFKLMSKGSNTLWQLPFKWAYLYSTTSVQNLDQSIEKDLYDGGLSHTYGLNTFGFILNPIQLNKIYRTEDSETDFEVIQGFNVPTAFFPIYKDFGPYLSIIYWFLMGIFLTFVFRRSENNPVYKILYGVSLANIIMSFHDNFFTGPLYWFGFILLLIVYREKSIFNPVKNQDKIPVPNEK